MKIKTQKDIEALELKIRQELEIELSDYRDEEVAEDFVDLFLFPKYIAKWIAIPLIIAFALFILGFFVVDLVHIQYLIYAVVGGVLFILCGTFGGIVYTGSKLKTDLSEITNYSLGVMKSSIDDMNDISHKITAENKKDVLSLLFQGIIHVVTIPMLTNAIDAKVPIGSKMTIKLFKNSLAAIASKFEFDEDNINENGETEIKKENLSSYISMITNANEGINKLLSRIIYIVQSPFRILFIICSILLVIFLFLIW